MRTVRARLPPAISPTPRHTSAQPIQSSGSSRSRRRRWPGVSAERCCVRTALITGGSGGIGKECGRKLAGLGYDVVLTARREEPLRAAAEEMGARYVVADASDPGKFAPAVEAAGAIDLIVHASGILGGTYARKQTFDQWRGTISAHPDSCFVVTAAALPPMKPGSRVVFLSSPPAPAPT